MSRTLYAWEKEGMFYLSAFVRHLNGRRPAAEFDTKLGLENEAHRRGAELAWQANGNE